MSEMDEILRRLYNDRRTVDRAALALYERMRRAKPRPHPLVRYWCDARGDNACLLLAVYASPRGPFVYVSGYKYSPAEAERQGTTRRRFDARAFMLERLDDPASGAWGACRHRILHLRPDVLRADAAAAQTGIRREVRRFLPDGTAEASVVR